MAEVCFPRTQWQTLGRNGSSESCGIQVLQQGAEVFLQPINSRGNVSRARLVVPLTHLRQIRDALNDILAGAGHSGE